MAFAREEEPIAETIAQRWLEGLERRQVKLPMI
jgi:hypothetical protein